MLRTNDRSSGPVVVGCTANFGPNPKVCCMKSGPPSKLFDDWNPDWAPSLHMGYALTSPSESRYCRRKERSQRKLTSAGMKYRWVFSLDVTCFVTYEKTDMTFDAFKGRHGSTHDDGTPPASADTPEDEPENPQAAHPAHDTSEQ
ncbi:hypothetical protein MTO96_041448 [Rhipicephalus appendiculatus]